MTPEGSHTAREIIACKGNVKALDMSFDFQTSEDDRCWRKTTQRNLNDDLDVQRSNSRISC